MSSQSPSNVSVNKGPGTAHQRSMIPEEYIDAPSQRIYMLSIGLLCQSIKVVDFFNNLWSTSPYYLIIKWLLVDALYCLTLSLLRIPRLTYSRVVVLLQISGLWLLDGVMFGGLQIDTSSTTSILQLPTICESMKYITYSASLPHINGIEQDQHLQGEHTVRMSPISTASLNSEGQAFCLQETFDSLLIPVLLNNTNPSHIQYSIYSVDNEKAEYFELSPRDLKAIEQLRIGQEQIKRTILPNDGEDEDDWDAEDLDNIIDNSNRGQNQGIHSLLERTQSVIYIPIHKPGLVRLEHIHDIATDSAARILSDQVSVVQCPKAQFVGEVPSATDMKCIHSEEQFLIRIFGMPPLSLRWRREINGRKEYFSVEGIDGTKEANPRVQQIDIPLKLSLTVPGIHQYFLEAISDSAGNTLTLAPNSLSKRSSGNESYESWKASQESELHRSLHVLRRASMSFKDCSLGHPANLLIGNETTLRIRAKEADPEDGPWTVLVRHEPDTQDDEGLTPQIVSLTAAGDKKDLTFKVGAAGMYTLLSVNGQYCEGDVLSPEVCRVVKQPFPTADIKWKGIHECSGDVGVSASLILHGKSPFQLYLQQQRNDEPPREISRTIQGSRGEITLQPEKSGNYTYSFLYISDANYKKIGLFGHSITQAVHPQAYANFVLAGQNTNGGKRTLSTCSGDFVSVEVDLRGKGPWNLTLQIVGPKATETIMFPNLSNNRETLSLPIPHEVNMIGGDCQVDLVSIEDAFGCKKDISVQGVPVSVRRDKPTAKFFTKQGKRELAVLEKEEARLPLRLTGEGPWKLKYKRVQPQGKVMSVILQSENDYLRTQDYGVYELLEVMDSRCPGIIQEGEADYLVNWVPRPTAKLAPNTVAIFESSKNSYIRPPVCEGSQDFVDLDLTGSPPFEIRYNVARESDIAGDRKLADPEIKIIQSRSRLQLNTSEVGRIIYDIRQIGDASYPLPQNRHHTIPVRERLVIEQQVLARPFAYFKSSSRLSYCLGDHFLSPDGAISDTVVNLEGQPPFTLELSLKDLGASSMHKEVVEIWDNQWKINLPHYQFTSVGPHLLAIESVHDASHCEPTVVDASRQSIWIDVAETAAIIPFNWREHLCVGDITEFQLEGTPPWTIGFILNDKYQVQTTKQSPFSWVQQQVGNFTVTSVSHQGNMCRTSVDNLNFQVHSLPSAQVAHGKDRFENINEGGQAHIVFTLIGQPPFTFTYQRSEPPPRKGARPGKILETHTVSGVYTHEYSIYSALEGTWTVKFISDKYCRYPPLQSDIN